MRHSKNEEEFKLDLTVKNEGDTAANDNDLQYSRDDTLGDYILKDLQEEDRQEELKNLEEMRRTRTEKIEKEKHEELTQLEKDPEMTAEDRRKERKAIFQKYKRKEQEVKQANNEDILQTFDEIFKRRSAKKQKIVQAENTQEMPVPAFKKTSSNMEDDLIPQPPKGITGPSNPEVKKVDDKKSVMFDSVKKAFEANLQADSLNISQSSASYSNVLADPTNSFEIPLPPNTSAETVIPTQISVIRTITGESVDSLKDQSMELQDLLRENIFSDMSQLDSIRQSTHEPAKESPKVSPRQSPKEAEVKPVITELRLPATMQQIDMKKKNIVTEPNETTNSPTKKEPTQEEQRKKQAQIDEFIKDVMNKKKSGKSQEGQHSSSNLSTESIHFTPMIPDETHLPYSLQKPSTQVINIQPLNPNEPITTRLFSNYGKQPSPQQGSPQPLTKTPSNPNSSPQNSFQLSRSPSGISSPQSSAHPPVFPQPLPNPQICQLLRQSFRLDSACLNLRNPVTHIFIPRMKQILSKTVYEMSMVTQTLWTFNEEIFLKEVQQKKMYVNFKPEDYKLGRWYLPIHRNIAILKGQFKFSNQPRRRGEYNQIQNALMNANNVLKKLGGIVQAFNLDPTSEESMTKYTAIKTALKNLMMNFLRICEDLYTKATTRYLPDHYYTFFEYFKNGSPPNTDLRWLLKMREDMQTQLAYLRNQKDPLCMSLFGEELNNELNKEIRRLRSDIKIGTIRGY